MASLLEVKKQIGGFKNTRKITKAMQLVAASKSRAFQKTATNIRKFALELLYILDHNQQNMDDGTYTQDKTEGKTVFVLYSSDKGLCGALNTQLIRGLMLSAQWKDTPEDEREIITIGRKAQASITYQGITPLASYEGISEKMTQYEALQYVEKTLDGWKEDKFKKVYMVAPHYKNTFTFYPLVKQFLPLKGEMIKTHLGVDPESFHKSIPDRTESFMLYEPSQSVVGDRLIDDLVHTLFEQAFYELKAAEYGSRMMAMQNATDSADKMIDEKTLVLNKARQAAITQEIAEIVAGSM